MKDIIVSTLIIVLLIFILSVQFLSGSGGSAPTPIPPEQIRSYAAALDSQGLYEQAVEEYEEYLNVARIPAPQRANLLYRIGTIYLDELEDYENALAVFLKISNLYPQSSVARDAEKRMVRCYEGMKRGFDAQKKLQQLTDLEPEEEEAGTGTVIAQIGDRKITIDQLEREIDSKGQYYRQNFNTPEKKLDYLKSMIFTDLLADAARRKEYHKDRDVRRKVSNFQQELLASKVYEEEVRQKIQVAPNDLELYYKANLSEFTEPKTVTVAHIQLDSEAKAKEVKQELDAGMPFEKAVEEYSLDTRTKANDGRLGSIQQGRDFIPGIGQNPELGETLLSMESDAISDPLQSPQGFHIFKILEVKPKKQLSFEEAKRQVEAKVRQMKEQTLQQTLLEQMMQAEKVKIFEDVLRREAATTAPAGNPSSQMNQQF